MVHAVRSRRQCHSHSVSGRHSKRLRGSSPWCPTPGAFCLPCRKTGQTCVHKGERRKLHPAWQVPSGDVLSVVWKGGNGNGMIEDIGREWRHHQDASALRYVPQRPGRSAQREASVHLLRPESGIPVNLQGTCRRGRIESAFEAGQHDRPTRRRRLRYAWSRLPLATLPTCHSAGRHGNRLAG